MDLAAHVDDRSPRGIAATVARLVRGGDLRPGDRLPTVRDAGRRPRRQPRDRQRRLAGARAVGIVISRGRAGTVRPARRPPAGCRRATATSPVARRPARPVDRHTRPRAAAPHRSGARRASPCSGRPPTPAPTSPRPVVPALEVLLRESWPFAPQRITVVDGALDAISRTLERVAGLRLARRRRGPRLPAAVRPARPARSRARPRHARPARHAARRARDGARRRGAASSSCSRAPTTRPA